MVFHFSFNMHSLITIEFIPLAVLVLSSELTVNIFYPFFHWDIFFILVYSYCCIPDTQVGIF